MKREEGIWFPDEEIHLVDMVRRSPHVNGRGAYQHHKLIAAVRQVKRKRVALDIGMHVGLWAMHLAKMFERVIGFEPVKTHIECLHANMAGLKNYTVHECALGDGRLPAVGMKILKGSTGSTHIDEAGDGIIMRTLDSFEFDVVDFIKVDVEGYEYQVIDGGKNTILKHKPVIIIEQKPGKVEYYGHKQHDASRLLESWGAKQAFEIKGDCCFVW